MMSKLKSSHIKVVDLAYSYDIIEKLLDARTAPSNDVAPAAPAASAKAGHANAIARVFYTRGQTQSQRNDSVKRGLAANKSRRTEVRSRDHDSDKERYIDAADDDLYSGSIWRLCTQACGSSSQRTSRK